MATQTTTPRSCHHETLYCGRCAAPAHVSDTACPGCDLDFNGSGRFARFEVAPSSLFLDVIRGSVAA